MSDGHSHWDGKKWVSYEIAAEGILPVTIVDDEPYEGIPCKEVDGEEYPFPAGIGALGGATREMVCFIAPETGEFDTYPVPATEIPADWQWVEYAYAPDDHQFYIYEKKQTDPDTGLAHRYFVRMLDAFEVLPETVLQHQKPIKKG